MIQRSSGRGSSHAAAMSVQHYFSEAYAQARDQFTSACRHEGAQPQRHIHPVAGPDGGELSTEVAWFGPRNAARLLVLISGVHGVEALPGSACQTGLMVEGRLRDLPGDTAVLLIHAINCYGAAHLRRNTDGNVDLCRNFMDFDQPLPVRPRYEDLHVALCCPQLEGPMRDAANAVLAEFVRCHGPDAYVQAVMGGQYQHADGFAYGGTAPVWANRMLGRILEEHAQHARQVCLVEYHTGLGPYAYGTAVTMHVDADLARARRWFGEWIHAPNQRDPGSPGEFYRVYGHTTNGYLRMLPQAEVTSIVLEYGTYPPAVSLPVMFEDHWLTLNGDPQSERGRAIKERLLRLHYPQDPDWREAVWQRSNQVVAQALRGLTRPR